ncbi:MAG TPA: hypothetical protein VFA04_14215 [Bryobacteraceae bacterium]|nr:hypothetical protein [Bryobacteraceae bacterium]
MDNTLLLVFTGIAAAALVIQALMLVMIGVAVLKMRNTVMEMLPKVEDLVAASKTTVLQSRKQIAEVTGKANEILDSTKVQLGKIDALITDASDRARVQMDRVELVLDETMDRAQSAVSAVHRGVTRPLKELHGIAVGIRATFAYLLRGGRPNVDQVTSDEEMFI